MSADAAEEGVMYTVDMRRRRASGVRRATLDKFRA